MQIVRGFVAPFRGAVFVVRHRLWTYLLALVGLNLLLVVAAGWAGGRWAARFLGVDVTTSNLDLVAWVITQLVVALIALLVFLVLQPVLAAPFVDLLAERCEKLQRGHAPSTGLMRSTAEALGHGLLKSGLYAGALALTLIAGALTGLGAVFGIAVYGTFLAYDGFDYPLARRNVSFRGKWRYLLSRPGQTVGYCFGAVILYLIPLAVVVAPAFAAVGATLLYLDSAPDDVSMRHQRHPASPPRLAS